MLWRRHLDLITHARCRYGLSSLFRYGGSRLFSQSRRLPQQSKPSIADENELDRVEEQAEMRQEVGRMTERLAQMTEESVEEGGRGARKAIEEAGFSEELKKRLEERIQDSTFKSENAAAFAEINLPSSAGRGTREQAAAQAWSGEESLGDAALRMLDDAHKPIRSTGRPKIPQPRAPSMSVDMRMKKAAQKSQGQRLANARDRTSMYALSQDSSLSEKEREDMRKVLKERFSPGGRPMPTSMQGLAALANERIEDAIGRGQFKNIPKGKGIGVERDHNADSPFLDTTEYFMNKMIKKQEIVPPWIEKQQELIKSAAHFRGRIRHDWKRHAARVIASSGGPLEVQVKRAEAYMAAEAALNPKATKKESISAIDAKGEISQVTITETPKPGASESQPDTLITVSATLPTDVPPPPSPVQATSPPTIPLPPTETPPAALPQDPTTSSPHPTPSPTLPTTPFRDPAWLSLESPYHILAIKSLNSQTRSYNLQAPSLAQKPYFKLDRELAACYADVAPQLPAAIVERARTPEKKAGEVVGWREGSVLGKFKLGGGGEGVKVYDSERPLYGVREFLRDWWGRGKG